MTNQESEKKKKPSYDHNCTSTAEVKLICCNTFERFYGGSHNTQQPFIIFLYLSKNFIIFLY